MPGMRTSEMIIVTGVVASTASASVPEAAVVTGKP